MNFFKEKITIIYLPFIKVALITNLVYGLLFWIVVVKFEWLPIYKYVALLFSSLLFIIIPIAIWLWPRNRLLHSDTKNSAPGLSIMQFIIISTFVIFTAILINKATGKLTKLQNVSFFEKVKPSKYYSLKNYFFKIKQSVYSYETYTSGKRDRNYNMAVHVVVPILNAEIDTINNTSTYWCAFTYKKEIDNSMYIKTKEAIFNNFKRECEKEINDLNFYDFSYMEEISKTSDFNFYENLIYKSQGSINKKPIIFEVLFTPFSERCTQNIIIICLLLFFGSLFFILIIIFQKFKEDPTTTYQTYFK